MTYLLKQLLSWIYKTKCYFCRKATDDSLMCKSCFEKIEILSAEPVKIIKNVRVFVAGLYDCELKNLIKAVKYHNKKDLAHESAKVMFSLWQNVKDKHDDYEIVPVPLYKTREKQRGFNQMLLIAKEFSKLTGYSVSNRLVERIRETKPQYNLSRAERRENLNGAFKVNLQNYSGKNILIVDDIFTTGSTIVEIVNELNRQGIIEITALAVAMPKPM